MPRFYQYADLVAARPVPLTDISWLAGQISRLPPFVHGVAVLCGSVAWGKPSWRSDIDVATFRTGSFPDIKPAIDEVIRAYEASARTQVLLPRADAIIVGVESERLVTRANLVRGSMPITQTQTIREVFAATSLRFFDHIGSLAAAKGQPWRAFHANYLSGVNQDRQVRRDEMRTYVASFADTWRQQPLRSISLDPTGRLDQHQLDVMAFAENFPFHLMRQVLAERGRYPSPDRAANVRAELAKLSGQSSKHLLDTLDPFLRITEQYAGIVDACRHEPPQISAREYHSRLVELFAALPFTEVEEAVWDYLSAKPPRRRRGTDDR
jgi:hypothetical protein